MNRFFSWKTFDFVLIMMMVYHAGGDSDICDRTPLGIKVAALRPDDKFILEVDQIKDDKYIPGHQYSVILRSKDENTKFIAFSISLKEDTIENKLNPRKPIPLESGDLEPLPNDKLAIPSTKCPKTIVQADVTPKTRVEVKWHAPGKDNKCVSIFAVVAVSQQRWYSFEPPLSLKVCEDPRKSEDMPPIQVDGDCDTCEDARYKLTFDGLWTYNTHHDMYPATQNGSFSDLVGASHSPDKSFFKFASEASIGIKMLAEQGNTTQFEIEIQSMLPREVRTVIKATKPENTMMSTVTSFRATPRHHRLSMAVGIIPSPDWFLGVTQMELCDDTTKKWKDEITLNLYPIDAGTDKGTDFESSNEEQSPPQPISQLQKIGKNGVAPTKPFARLLLQRVRTYTTPRCLSEEGVTEAEGENEDNETDSTETDENENGQYYDVKSQYPTQRTTTTSEETDVDAGPRSTETCPMTEWGDWSPCEGICADGTVTGIQTRFRHHIVDGIIVRNMENAPQVSQHCLINYPETEYQTCTDSCGANEGEENEEEETQEEEPEASRRMWRNFVG